MILTMNRHAAIALMLAACPLSASADQPQKQTPDQRPNIVVIVTSRVSSDASRASMGLIT